MSIRKATLQDVITSVCHADAGTNLPKAQVSKVVDLALRTVIGLNCLGREGLHIDLGNGHTLVCQVKKAVGPTDV